MASRSELSFRMKNDAPTDHPGDLAFDRPSPEELVDIAWAMVEDLERAGFTRDEIREVLEAMETIAETRRNGIN
jgi:hypothetical protein